MSHQNAFFVSEGSDCLKANAQSCGDCIQVAENCGWCTDEVSANFRTTENVITYPVCVDPLKGFQSALRGL